MVPIHSDWFQTDLHRMRFITQNVFQIGSETEFEMTRIQFLSVTLLVKDLEWNLIRVNQLFQIISKSGSESLWIAPKYTKKRFESRSMQVGYESIPLNPCECESIRDQIDLNRIFNPNYSYVDSSRLNRNKSYWIGLASNKFALDEI